MPAKAKPVFQRQIVVDTRTIPAGSRKPAMGVVCLFCNEAYLTYKWTHYPFCPRCRGENTSKN